MSILDILYTVFIMPLQLVFEVLYVATNRFIGDPGLSIVALSLMMNFLVLPLYMRADAMQEHERVVSEKLRDGVAHIKKTFSGDERMMMLQTYYRQNDYKPTDVFKGSISLFLEIPFFIAAYLFLSHLQAIQGVPFGVIPDLGAPDGLLVIGDVSINVLPFIMTGVNLVSCVLFTKGMPTKTKVQLYGMALFFLVFLYSSPAGLVFYWTLNNVFALIKTIFYKLKNPKKVLTWLAAIVGAGVLAYCCVASGSLEPEKIPFLIVFGLALMVPLAWTLLRNRVAFLKNRQGKPGMAPNKKVFVCGVLFLTVLLGLLIPSAVIGSSPQEFFNMRYFVNPLFYLLKSFCLAAGMFLVWFAVFYWLCNRRAKVVFETAVLVACGVALVDYLFFGTHLGFLSSTLQYEGGFHFTDDETMWNCIAIIAVGVVFVFAMRKLPKVAPFALGIGTAALLGMSVVNIGGIATSVNSAMPSLENARSNEPSLTLSKNGQNVVVIMLDRAKGSYVPYMFAEKPELKEKYSGFTYYDNVISFGPCTNIAAPALYGGYEYTPAELNARSDEPLASKHDEAVKLMPALFDENDFEVTVCDPTYAGYEWTPNLSIYDDRPDIKTYITDGRYTTDAENRIAANMRNFFCFGVMKSSPVVVQKFLYDGGQYNSSTATELSTSQSISNNGLVAEGMRAGFANCYPVLEKLPEMTEIAESGNTFLMMSNNTTHEPMILKEPEYQPERNVDNTEWEAAHPGRFTVDGRTMAMWSIDQKAHYQVNMAAFLQIAKWLDYLRENGVYDNTRIILVGDHGYPLGNFPNETISDSRPTRFSQLESYFPLLMVKDFNAQGFSVSDEFMTNGDTPTIAMSGLIDSPVNPFTGKAIDSSAKTDGPLYVFSTEDYNVSTNNGNTFAYHPEDEWFTVHDDMRDLSNWSVVAAP